MATNDSRIGSSAQPPSNSGGGGEAQILVRISPVIEREFGRRNVFVELRIDRAEHIINGATGVHRVGLARAREVLADAVAQRGNCDLPRGTPMAYGSLASNLRASIKQEERRGVWDDPGREEARQRQAAASARFEVGDAVLFFPDGSEYGVDATVVLGYETYSALREDGAYIDSTGARFNYKPGYCVLCKDTGSRSFASAWQLTRDDCKPSHLRLVACGAAR